MRYAIVLALVIACAPARSPVAGRTGMVMALAGVATIITSATIESEYDDELMVGGSVVSAGGILLAAAHQLTTPASRYLEEPTPIKHARWARILTEHAAGAARSGNCSRVRKFEPRVRVYDATYHDFVFMRDPEIVRCLSPGAPPSIDAGDR